MIEVFPVCIYRAEVRSETDLQLERSFDCLRDLVEEQLMAW